MTFILLLHRYLGVVAGVVMTLWCLSGFVMMYQSMPDVSERERLAGLAPLDLAADWAAAPPLSSLPLADDLRIRGFRIETLGGRPVLRLRADGPERLYDLASGEQITEIGEEDARAAARAFRSRQGLSAVIARSAIVDRDQWTLQLRRHAPLRRFDFADPERSSVYVSGRTGEVVQATTLRTRALAWLGAIPHWLYPTLLRQNGPLWTYVVIGLSILGIFLTVTGLMIGVARLRGRSGRWLPYKGVWLWHHVGGLVFGVLTLTWVASGLFTMQPWGLFTSAPPFEQSDVYGTTTWREARALLQGVASFGEGGEIAQLRVVTAAGAPVLVGARPDGRNVRYVDDALDIAPLQAALRARGGPLADATVVLQTAEDAYYYGHHEPVPLPVLRVRLTDGSSLYLHPNTGDLLRYVDGTEKARRWLESGLHSLDFPGLRARPLWDVVTIALLLGVTFVCGTGTWLAIRRVRRDLTPEARFTRNPMQAQ